MKQEKTRNQKLERKLTNDIYNSVINTLHVCRYFKKHGRRILHNNVRTSLNIRLANEHYRCVGG